MRIDAGLPEPIRRPMRWSVAVGFAVVPIVLSVFILSNFGLTGRFELVLVFVPMWVWIGIGLLSRRAAKRALRRAAAHDHLRCPQCLDDLRTLDEAGACPECGRAYEHEAVRRQWLDAARRLKRTRGDHEGRAPAG